ncbi:MAG: FtsX-like permease family protein [bacterium]|nr:FtsX-like permease family protein [bacterium]
MEEDENHNQISRQVVGVVGNVRPFGLDSPEQPTFYLPQAQFEVDWQVFAVRSDSEQDPMALAGSIRRAVLAIDPHLLVHSVTTMPAMIERSLRTRKAVLGLLSVLGCMAVVAAGVGLFGLLSYRVQQSRKEIGIRSALGAPRTAILHLVFTRGLRLTAIGILAGLFAAALCARAMGALLFGVHAVDLPVFAACSAALLGVAVTASAVPSWRALHLNPAEELRRE